MYGRNRAEAAIQKAAKAIGNPEPERYAVYVAQERAKQDQEERQRAEAAFWKRQKEQEEVAAREHARQQEEQKRQRAEAAQKRQREQEEIAARERAKQQKGQRHQRNPSLDKLSALQALEIFGLNTGATKQQIHAAYNRLMKRVHPDVGGSNFFAKQLNEARDLLLVRAR
jgi:hypothetical protein